MEQNDFVHLQAILDIAKLNSWGLNNIWFDQLIDRTDYERLHHTINIYNEASLLSTKIFFQIISIKDVNINKKPNSTQDNFVFFSSLVCASEGIQSSKSTLTSLTDILDDIKQFKLLTTEYYSDDLMRILNHHEWYALEELSIILNKKCSFDQATQQKLFCKLIYYEYDLGSLMACAKVLHKNNLLTGESDLDNFRLLSDSNKIIELNCILTIVDKVFQYETNKQQLFEQIVYHSKLDNLSSALNVFDDNCLIKRKNNPATKNGLNTFKLILNHNNLSQLVELINQLNYLGLLDDLARSQLDQLINSPDLDNLCMCLKQVTLENIEGQSKQTFLNSIFGVEESTSYNPKS